MSDDAGVDADPQLTAYDAFEEAAEETFRIFDEGEKHVTGTPLSFGHWAEGMLVVGNTIAQDEPALHLAAG